MEYKFLLVIEQRDYNYGMEKFYSIHSTLEKAKAKFEEEKKELIEKTIENLDSEEEIVAYREEVEDNEMYDPFGDYECSCADIEGDWQLYIIKILEN